MDSKNTPQAGQSQLTVDEAYSKAIDHFNAMRYTESDKLCTAIIQAAPNHIDAINLLGVIAQKVNRHDLAVELFQRAINIANSRALLFYNLGTSLYPLGRRNEAIQALKTALEKEPGNSQIADYLSGILKSPVSTSEIGNPQDKAQESLQRGISFHQSGQLDEAIFWYRKTLEINPENTIALSNLGFALQTSGQLELAVASYQQAISIKPDYADAYYNLGNALKEQDKQAEAVSSYQQAISIKPDYAEARSNLGNILTNQGKLDKAVSHFQKALAVKPDYAEAHYNLGFAFQEQGKFELAVTSYQKALSIQPDYADAYSNLLFVISYYVLYSPDETLKYHQQWDEVHGKPGLEGTFLHTLDSKKNVRLKIGYVSSDFKQHPVSNFLREILINHNRSNVQIYCYASVIAPDIITSEFQQLPDVWRDIIGLNDLQVAQQIYDDKIDILIDLTGHTRGNRLKVFTYKPAPVQATYLGYCTTTGLQSMDYWITDSVLTPEETQEQAVETIVRLPNCWVCYQSRTKPTIMLSERSSDAEVVFGSFNNLAKTTESVAMLWSKILLKVPKSKLLLKTGQLANYLEQNRIYSLFGKYGIHKDRLILKPASDTYMEEYGFVDIALDPFPRTGGATTMDALWMGVPVITLAGQRMIERQGVSLLTAIGESEWIANTVDEYVIKAVNLAGKGIRNTEQRLSLHNTVVSSALCDYKGFVADLEAAYRRMWNLALLHKSNDSSRLT